MAAGVCRDILLLPIKAEIRRRYPELNLDSLELYARGFFKELQ